MDEGGRCVSIGKGAQVNQSLVELPRRWRPMDDFPIGVLHPHIFTTAAQATGPVCRVKGVLGDAAVQVQHQFRRQC